MFREVWMCFAWVGLWLLCHYLAHFAALSLQRCMDGEARVPKQCVYLRRICRGQVYCVLSLAGAMKLMLRWSKPQDLFFDFSWQHQVLFSMAAGHWLVSLWEDWQSRKLLSGGLDSKAIPGIRDPAALLFKGYALHHLGAALGYVALLHTQRISAVGLIGCVFELPVLLLNRRELLRLLQQQPPRASLVEHWRMVYSLFLVSRAGAFALYAYALTSWQDHIDSLEIIERWLLHVLVVFFGVLNCSFLTVMDAMSRSDAYETVAHFEEDLEDDGCIDAEAPCLRPVSMQEFSCNDWHLVDGMVYDLKSFEHPGGNEALCRCAGRDAREDFEQCPATAASLVRFQVGPLSEPALEYRIFEHPEEERRMRRLLLVLVASLGGASLITVSADGVVNLLQETWEPLPGAILTTLVGALSLLLPRRLALEASQSVGWKAHATAILILLHHILLPAAMSSNWPGPGAPAGGELTGVAILLVEICLAPAALPPFVPVVLCLGSWSQRGLSLPVPESIYLPWRKSLVYALTFAMLMRLVGHAGRRGLALCSLYGAAASIWFLSSIERWATPAVWACLLVVAATSLVAHCAVFNLARQCSASYATRWVAFLLTLSLLWRGLSSFRWVMVAALLKHLFDLARLNRDRLDEAKGRFSSLGWHLVGAQAVWDSSRVVILSFIWRTVVCNAQHVISAIVPEGLRVYACEVPIPNYGDKVSMGVAAQYVPPEARGKTRKPNFFVCNVGQIAESCVEDLQHTLNTLVDVWGEFHEPTPGLCGNVVMIFPTSQGRLAKEINLSCWESGKDAFDWYVKSKGHKKALMQHTSGLLRTFGNLLASLEPREPLRYQDRCRRCHRRVESVGDPAPNLCGVCGAPTFRYNNF